MPLLPRFLAPLAALAVMIGPRLLFARGERFVSLYEGARALPQSRDKQAAVIWGEISIYRAVRGASNGATIAYR